jgi:4'-phosphopantetheinyl transferase
MMMTLGLEDRLDLPPHQVHVWYLATGARLNLYLRSLAKTLNSPQERATSNRFLIKERQESYLLARILLRVVLSKYVNISPQSWTFRTNASGKPEIDLPKMYRFLRFSLTQTDGFMACAVAADREIGIDAEAISRIVEIDTIADYYFAPVEASALQTLPPGLRRRRFFELWTLKEAYLKARGVGLSLPLEKILFNRDEGEMNYTLDASIDDPRNWRFYLLQPTVRHLVAVALPYDDHVMRHAQMELLVMPLEDVINTRSGTSRAAPTRGEYWGSQCKDQYKARG